MWPGFSTPGVDAICGLSLLLVLSLAPRGFSPGTPVFPSPQKLTLPNSNSIWNARTCLNEFIWTSNRLRVVPHFSSGIVERAKRERAWKSPHARKGDTRQGQRILHGGTKIWILFSSGKIIFYQRAQRVSKILFLPRENEIHVFKPPCNVLFIM